MSDYRTLLLPIQLRPMGLLLVLLLLCAGRFNITYAQSLKDQILPLVPTEDQRFLKLNDPSTKQNIFGFKLHDTPLYYMIVHISLKDSNHPNKGYKSKILVGTQNIFHEVKVVSSSSNSTDYTFSWSTYDAHSITKYSHQSLSFKPDLSGSLPENFQALELRKAKLNFSCSQEINGVVSEVKKELKSLPYTEVNKLLTQARFYKPVYTTHRAHRLFRDDWGVYYYIEENKNPAQGQRYRLWMGYRRAMKLIPVITAASDSEGVVLVSKDAAIRLVADNRQLSNQNKENYGAYWTEGNKQKVLLEVPVDRNQGLIFNELGLYDSLYLGSFCDPLFNRSPLILNTLANQANLQKK